MTSSNCNRFSSSVIGSAAANGTDLFGRKVGFVPSLSFSDAFILLHKPNELLNSLGNFFLTSAARLSLATSFDAVADLFYRNAPQAQYVHPVVSKHIQVR